MYVCMLSALAFFMGCYISECSAIDLATGAVRCPPAVLAFPDDLRPFYPGCPWGTPGTGATSGGRELVSVIVGRGGRRGGDIAILLEEAGVVW